MTNEESMGLWPLAVALVAVVIVATLPLPQGLRRLLMFVLIVTGFWVSSSAIERWFFTSFELRILDGTEFIAGNEIRMPASFFSKRRLRLDGTALPRGAAEQERARQALAAMLKDGRVRIEFVKADENEPAVWVVRLRVRDRDPAGELIARGLLLPVRTGQPSPDLGAAAQLAGPRREAAPWSIIAPSWVRDRPSARWVVWGVLGLIGALGLGLLRNAVTIGGGLLLAPGATAVYDIVRAQRAGESLAPPLVSLGLILLFGGYCAVRLRPYIEELSSDGKSR